MSCEVKWAPPSNVSGRLKWVHSSSGHVPLGAVKVGMDEDGGIMFVGRALHEEDILPAKVCPSHGCAFVGYEGKEYMKIEYQVLCSSEIAWKSTSGNSIPEQAIRVGRTSTGEPLYAGRASVNGFMSPGKVHPSHKCLYVPFGGEEKSFEEYEILILK